MSNQDIDLPHITCGLVLASGSQRRIDLLKEIGLSFTVQPSGINEDNITADEPGHLATKLALAKASRVAKNKKQSVIIGADTIVVHKNKILGKPRNQDDAHSMLLSLSNSTHSVITGMALIKTDANGNSLQKLSFHEQTKVTVHNLDDLNLQTYLKTNLAMDKAGAYGIQNGWGALFVESIHGDFFNVMGLPLQLFYRKLKSFAPECLKNSNIL